MDPQQVVARRISVRGVVQGVGFRPFVFRVARRHAIHGWVRNGAAGVEIHAQGSPTLVDSFLADIRAAPPTASRISEIEISATDPTCLTDFTIVQSDRAAAPTAHIVPDLCVCTDCLREMNNDQDRRHQYPYINCTNCGPRYSIIRGLPYDRQKTTMADWQLCDDCQREYTDASNRRYHAQPTACPECGPTFQLWKDGRVTDKGGSAIRLAAQMLARGKILAIKGIGGYHLSCDATNADAVAGLRIRKYRKEKPFAMIVRDVCEAGEYVDLGVAHIQLLCDTARPIVLAAAKKSLPGVAPDNAEFGIMLPYAPLHHLLFEHGAPSPLIMTSGNRSNEPISFRDEEALERLSDLSDAILIGERPIARRVDDSVVTIRQGKPFHVRRSRGYAPGIVASLPANRPILALGGDLKNTIALVVDGQVLISQHIGDLEYFESQCAFEETVRDLLEMYDLRLSEITIAHDLHPEFHSTQFARNCAARHRVSVQHHHAHIASVLAEHDCIDERVIGVALDGTGYGTDASIWGGEFFVGSATDGFERVLSFRPVQMPGGDAAARFPVQAAAGFLADLDEEIPDLTKPPFDMPPRFRRAMDLVRNNVRCFRSTSAGRLFDAVAAVLGFVGESTFEGQAAMWLEMQARQVPRHREYPFLNFDHRPLLTAILKDRIAGHEISEIARGFHVSLAKQVAFQIVELCSHYHVFTAALSGGVFQNKLLFDLVHDELQNRRSPHLITNRIVPVNDGGLCLGQAAMACGNPTTDTIG